VRTCVRERQRETERERERQACNRRFRSSLTRSACLLLLLHQNLYFARTRKLMWSTLLSIPSKAFLGAAGRGGPNRREQASTLAMTDVWLYEWALVSEHPSDPYHDPATFSVAKLKGVVYGHPWYRNGSVVITSAVLCIDGDRAQTVSRWYKLGSHIPSQSELERF
jgi:hypothetical protein